MDIDKAKRVEEIRALRLEITEPGSNIVTVWVDTYSGLWGTMGGLKIVELEAEVAEGWDEGAASDMEIADYAREHGRDAK